jgi:hypothetical protein
MKIHNSIDPINSRYHIQIHIHELSALEEQLIKEVGPPVINIGGIIAAPYEENGNLIDVEFKLPNRYRRIPTDFPVKQIFDLVDYSNAEQMAHVYAQVITKRLIAAKDELVSDHRDPSGDETLITV